MTNCIVAQSGGPSSVINATIAGIIKANQLNPLYEHVYGGLHGIEGILQEKFVDLTNMSEEENAILQQTPSRHWIQRQHRQEEYGCTLSYICHHCRYSSGLRMNLFLLPRK